jgi:hypothetical protein
VRTRILRIEEDEKRVGLSMRGVAQPTEEELAELNAASGEVEEETEADSDRGDE